MKVDERLLSVPPESQVRCATTPSLRHVVRVAFAAARFEAVVFLARRAPSVVVFTVAPAAVSWSTAVAAKAAANITVLGPPAEPATVALPDPTVARPWMAAWTVAAAAALAMLDVNSAAESEGERAAAGGDSDGLNLVGGLARADQQRVLEFVGHDLDAAVLPGWRRCR